ncbi:dickkopf-related protein 4 [Rhinatrema bivittatum]|uniref:dickkopf-related protein 4 n=1 Tax=Rhinatrema bivittatum TaxID=194408 RepID=UPI00112DED7A|nr:dickkopf-related protein 4 [Rhinatrema bivittatum]
MVALLILGLSSICAPISALLLDSNTIKSSAEVQNSRKGPRCSADRDCSPGKFCFNLGDELPFCATCRGLRRRCQRSSMCCPGSICLNDICTQVEELAPIEEKQQEEQDSKAITQHQIQENKFRKKPYANKPQSRKGKEGDGCLRTSDCAQGLCCTRHFWTKICKPILMEGQVCSSRRRKDSAQGPQIFQRCDCRPGLICRAQVSAASSRSRLRVCQTR